MMSLVYYSYQYQTNPSPTSNAEEAEQFCEDLHDLLELTHTQKKRFCFHHRTQECKSRKSRDNWSNRQV